MGFVGDRKKLGRTSKARGGNSGRCSTFWGGFAWPGQPDFRREKGGPRHLLAPGGMSHPGERRGLAGSGIFFTQEPAVKQNRTSVADLGAIFQAAPGASCARSSKGDVALEFMCCPDFPVQSRIETFS